MSLGILSGFKILHPTARQYGEVVLPDDSTEQGPVTLARSPERSEGSRCEEGMARVFAIRAEILLTITSVAVQG